MAHAPSAVPLIAVDGPSGSGKSTVSRRVAQALAGRYVDTGATYRALTWALLARGVDTTDPQAVAAACDLPSLHITTDPLEQRVHADGVDVTEPIRGEEVTRHVSAVAAVPAVRERMVRWQREMAQDAVADGVPLVMEGRDIGSVVLPEARVKVWLTADVTARAARRAAEDGVHHAHSAASLTRRDALDSGRAVSPALAAPDAVVVDATHLGIDEVVQALLRLVHDSPAP